MNFPTTQTSPASLCGFGRPAVLESTGSYGVGVARYLEGRGVEVTVLDRPNRQARR